MTTIKEILIFVREGDADVLLATPVGPPDLAVARLTFDQGVSWYCESCDDFHADPVDLPVYECPACDTTFTAETGNGRYGTQCPDCNKFGAKLANHACPDCDGPLGEAEAITCLTCDRTFAEDRLAEHLANEHDLGTLIDHPQGHP